MFKSIIFYCYAMLYDCMMITESPGLMGQLRNVCLWVILVMQMNSPDKLINYHSNGKNSRQISFSCWRR